MVLPSFLRWGNFARSCFTPRARGRRQPTRPSRRPALESLETRDCPSGGLLDPTFGSGGFVLNTSVLNFNDVLVQTDGKIVAGGWGNNLVGSHPATTEDFAVARYNSDGTLDASFGSGGLASVDINRDFDRANAVAVQPGSGGKILAAGNSGSDFAIARLNPNGTLDTTFGNSKTTKGKVTVDLGAFDVVSSMAVLPDGKILLAGSTGPARNKVNGTIALVRLNANGTLDTTFGSGGKVVTSIGIMTNGSGGSGCVPVTVDSSGRIVVCATSTYATTPPTDFVVARFTSAGALDSTFGTSGVVTTDIGSGSSDQAHALGLQTDGKIVVGGSSEGLATVARYNPDGTLDASFGQGGIASADVDLGGPPSASASDLVVQPDGKILLGGSVWDQPGPYDNFLMRFNADGSLDTSYGSQGTGWAVAGFGPSYNAGVSAMAVQADGGVILVGNQASVTYPYPQSGDLARYLPSGPVVASFTASPSPAPAGSDVTLAASVAPGNPGAPGAVAQVAFYTDSNGDGVLDPATDALLGYATYDTGSGQWRLTFSTTGWTPGSHRLFARACDGYGAWGDPFALTLDVL
jgi:uncharacterized delta-60 repeat protein